MPEISLLTDYKAAVIRAYQLGLELQKVYSVLPPKVVFKASDPMSPVIGLTINAR